MKIVGATFVYNDYEYLDQTLECFKNFPDKHFIIEGSWRSNQKSSGVSLRSDQQTYDIINKHVDNRQVFLIQANEERERNQRQVGMELAKKEGADWFFMTDADEVYPKKSLDIIKNILQRTPDYMLGYRIHSYNFINSFKKWYNGDYMRLYRVTPKAEFVMDNDVAWTDKDGMIAPMPGGYLFYHYNYVRKNTTRFWNMMRYQHEQDQTFWKRMIDSGPYKEEAGIYKIPDDIKIYDFIGKHPTIMKNHPYFKNDVFGDGEISYE